GPSNELRRWASELRVDQVFLAVPNATNEQLVHLINTCDDLRVQFKLVPDLLEVMSTRVAADAIDGLPLIGIRHSRLRGAAAIVKRATDLVVSTLGLILASPIMLIIAAAIQLTSPQGP